MGEKLYDISVKYASLLDQEKACIVEIGSERGEGSTDYLSQLARDKSTELYTVDIVENDIPEKVHLKKFTMTGEDFLENQFSKLDRRIAILYLDNFDWIWDESNVPDWIRNQISFYQTKGLTMNNVNSTITHMRQMILAEPFLCDKALVICDDTFYLFGPGTYAGKCSAVVYYLLSKGWRIAESRNSAIALIKD